MNRLGGFVWVLVCAVFGLSPTTLAFAADAAYPTKPVRFVVPFTVAGGTDLVARLLAEKLTVLTGQSFVVENRPGAGGNIGSEIIARAAPDGYTIGMGAIGTHAINPHLFRNIPFDPIRDFTPISAVSTSMLLLVVNSSVPATSVAELVKLMQARPGQLNFPSPGNGTTGQLAGALLENMAGARMTNIPFNGPAASRNSVLSGDTQVTFELATSVLPHVRSGRLRALGVTGLTRSRAAPELPTLAEAGLPGFEVVSWISVIGPPGLPANIVDTLNRHIRTVLTQPDTIRKLDEMGTDPAPSTPAELRQRMERDNEKWGKVIRASGIKLD